MSKKKNEIVTEEDRNTLYESTRDAAVEVAQKNRKLYDFLTYLGMMGTLICLLLGQIRFALVCILLTVLFMNISLISRTKEEILNSMVDRDQIDRFFKKQNE